MAHSLAQAVRDGFVSEDEAEHGLAPIEVHALGLRYPNAIVCVLLPCGPEYVTARKASSWMDYERGLFEVYDRIWCAADIIEVTAVPDQRLRRLKDDVAFVLSLLLTGGVWMLIFSVAAHSAKVLFP